MPVDDERPDLAAGPAADSRAASPVASDPRAPDAVATDPLAPESAADPRAAEHEEPLSIGAQLRDAVQRAGIAQVAPGEAPSGRALLTAVGGVRGLAESILPGFAFLVVYAITHELVPSVVIPVVVALVFVVIRLLQRQSLATSLAGILGVAISAGLSLITGRAESNFIPGIVINAVCLVVLLVTLAIRRPLIGIVVGVLLADGDDWRADAGKRRVLTVATWLWAGLFALRLAIEIPLYLAAEVELLAGIKLITGVPLYAALLWVTWLLVRTVFRSTAPEDAPAAADAPVAADSSVAADSPVDNGSDEPRAV